MPMALTERRHHLRRGKPVRKHPMHYTPAAPAPAQVLVVTNPVFRGLKPMANLSRPEMESELISALGGGSNYWYWIPTTEVMKVRDATPEMEGSPLAFRIMKAVMERGVRMGVTDVNEPNPETQNPLGYLTRDSMLSAMSKMMKPEGGNRRMAAQILAGDSDADTGDVWFQFAVMGKQVFA